MGQKQAIKVPLIDLRRLWSWTVNSTPREGSYRALRQACKELRPLVRIEIDQKGYPKLPDTFELEEQVVCGFSEAALAGFKEAAAQAIRGENHPTKEPAPFGSIEFLILPIAEKLGFAEHLGYECPMICNARMAE